MDDSRRAQLKRHHRKLINASMSKTKACYFIGCEQPTIRAHSISNKRLLLKLSDEGHVMHFDKDSPKAGTLIATGRGAATTFNGFCGDHDKIFHPIDNEDYAIGNDFQEYLFAMRAAAKEYTTRVGVGDATATRIENRDPEFAMDDEAKALMETFKLSFDIGTNDQRDIRKVFNETYEKGKLNAINTAIIEVNEELPIAVSSAFNIELDIDGNVINDVSPSGLETKMKPSFFTVFPQNGKTYCLVSYMRKDKASFKFLHDINSQDEVRKQVIISNLLTSYTENFVANPTYWNSLSKATLALYTQIYGNSFKAEYAPFIADENFNLFPSAQA